MKRYILLAMALAVFLSGFEALHAALPPNRSTYFDGATGINYGVSSYYNSSVAMTIEAWVYRVTANNCETIVAQNFNDSYWFGFCTHPRFYRSGGLSADSTGIVPACRWTHVAVSYDGSHASFYIDGQPAGVVALANAGIGNTQSLLLGSDPVQVDTNLTATSMKCAFGCALAHRRRFKRTCGVRWIPRLVWHSCRTQAV